jgi:RNA-directed DNA polymerase
MKTYKNLYSQVLSFENLYCAYRAARKGKRENPAVSDFEFNLESNLLRLQNELLTQTYSPGAYTNFYVHEPKRRLVSAAPFRDRVVHHALCKVIEPVWERRFIYHSYACRVGKGTHKALDQCQSWVRQYRFSMHGDIVKYFPAIDHQINNWNNLRSANRNNNNPDNRNNNIGFRLVSPKLKRMDGFPLLNRLLSRP